MAQIFYNNISKDILEEDLIETLKSIHLEYQHKKPYILALYLRDVRFNLGIGDINNNTIMMYDTFLDKDDTLIAYNPATIGEDRFDDIYIFHCSSSEIAKHWKRCLIPFDEVLKELLYYIENNCLPKISNIGWHAY